MDVEQPQVLLDALPYVDQHYNDPRVMDEVDRLVEAEMRTFQPPNYLEAYPDYEISFVRIASVVLDFCHCVFCGR